MSSKRQEESGRLAFADGIIEYIFPSGVAWTLKVADLLLVGEYTNQNGPIVDDYFLVFVTKDSRPGWYEASFYSEGSSEFLKQLGHKLNSEFNFELFHSTDFKSRVMWPPELDGAELFKFEREPKAPNLRERIRQLVLPRMQFCLLQTVQDFINRRK